MLPASQTFPAYLQRLYDENKQPVEVFNLGVTGYNIQQIIHLLEARGVTLNPDIVVYGFCLNDLFDHSAELTFIQEYGHLYRSRILDLRTFQWLAERLHRLYGIEKKYKRSSKQSRITSRGIRTRTF